MTVGSHHATASIVQPGRIRLESGREFQTPSPAASAVASGASLAGWNYWQTAEGRTLDSLRQELLDQVASDATEGEGSIELQEPGVLSARGLTWLKEVRERALGGDQTAIRLRDLLAYWNLDRRDSVAANHVVTALAERGLVATPNVLATSLEDTVVIGLPSRSRSGEGRAADFNQGPDAVTTVGLVLSSFMEAGRPLVSVQPQHTLGQARSLMRLNGYSQLAILNGRTLKGAVTWESIAQALFAGSDANSLVTDARIHAQGHPAERHLLEVIGEINATGFVIVIGSTGPAGIVTYSDIADSFVDIATPFALIGDLDRRLRRVLEEALDWDSLQAILARDDSRTPATVDDLTFGNYVTAFASADVWDQLEWWVNHNFFVERLDQLRLVRNAVTHFNPDPPSGDDIEKLRIFNELVIELSGL